MLFAFFLLMAIGSVVTAHELQLPNHKSTSSLDERTYKKLQKLQEKIEADEFADAEEGLKNLLSSKSISTYAETQILNSLGYLYFTQERYSEAIDIFEKIIVIDKVPTPLFLQSVNSLAQLYMIEEDYHQAIHYLKDWFALLKQQEGRNKVTPQANDYALLAQLYYLLNDLPLALANINKAISIYEEKGKLAKENWLQIKLSIFYQQDLFNEMVSVLELLCEYYSKPTYWSQLASTFAQLEKFDRQLQTLDIAYINNNLEKERNLLSFVSLLAQKGDFHRAGTILEKHLNNGDIKSNKRNWQRLGNYWYNAKEIRRSLTAMEKSISYEEDIRLLLRLANINLHLQQYSLAQDFANQVIKAKDVDNRDTINAYVILGIASVSKKDFSLARESFEQAANIEGSKKNRAEEFQNWLNFIDYEEAQYQLAQEYL